MRNQAAFGSVAGRLGKLNAAWLDATAGCAHQQGFGGA
jgi:hypothetical protein